jgi:hypothetical protein
MPEVKHTIVVAVLLIAAWFLLRERKPKPAPVNDFEACRRSYEQIKAEIDNCCTIPRLQGVLAEADDFFNNYYGKVKLENLKAWYYDLTLSIGVRRNKLTPDENSYA